MKRSRGSSGSRVIMDTAAADHLHGGMEKLPSLAPVFRRCSSTSLTRLRRVGRCSPTRMRTLSQRNVCQAIDAAGPGCTHTTSPRLMQTMAPFAAPIVAM
jgi:hypothetical protein